MLLSDFNSLVYKLNREQRVRFIDFLNSLKEEGLRIAYTKNFKDITIDEVISDIDSISDYEIKRAKKDLAATKGETTIPKNNWGVHETHCCSKHGCKYGDSDCPVDINLTKQKYPCEFCED